VSITSRCSRTPPQDERTIATPPGAGARGAGEREPLARAVKQEPPIEARSTASPSPLLPNKGKHVLVSRAPVLPCSLLNCALPPHIPFRAPPPCGRHAEQRTAAAKVQRRLQSAVYFEVLSAPRSCEAHCLGVVWHHGARAATSGGALPSASRRAVQVAQAVSGRAWWRLSRRCTRAGRLRTSGIRRPPEMYTHCSSWCMLIRAGKWRSRSPSARGRTSEYVAKPRSRSHSLSVLRRW
jgi:hypothetical protein